MSGRSYEVQYHGCTQVSRFYSEPSLYWTAREATFKNTARRVNIAIHNCSINILGDTGLVAGIPFSFQSPYSLNTSPVPDTDTAILYITELEQASLHLSCHVFLVDSLNKALKLKEDIELLKEGALHAKQRTLQRQVTETLEKQVTGTEPANTRGGTEPAGGNTRLIRHRRSLSEDRLPSSVTAHLEKLRRSSVDTHDVPVKKTAHRRRKSTPVKCREIYDVEYLGFINSSGSELPDIDRIVYDMNTTSECNGHHSALNQKGLLHIGQNEIQLLNMDHVTLKRAWPVKHIKACSQGVTDPTYVGWSCREVAGSTVRECVQVLRTASPDMGVTILHSIHRMCLSAYSHKEHSYSTESKGLCRRCPVVIFNDICERISGLTPDEVAFELGSVIDNMSVQDSCEVLQMFKTEDRDLNVRNSLLVGCVREVFERQQLYHRHEDQGKQKNVKLPEVRRTRAVTVADPVELESKDNTNRSLHLPLKTANDRRMIRRQRSSFRKTIFDSVTHATDKESRLESMLSEEPPTTLPGSQHPAPGYDLHTQLDNELEQHWDALFRRQGAGVSSERGKKEVDNAVFSGVPDSVRRKVWRTLCHGRRSKHKIVSPTPLSYQQLIDNAPPLAKVAINVDIGRTYPSHPFYKQEGGRGQTLLRNTLLAYSAYDLEVGYCQGLGFVAGILGFYNKDSEEEAFELLKDLLTKYGLREVYKPHMTGLKLRLYQISRLVHDRYFHIHEHLNTHEVTPSLYAVPWIMTAFATSLPFTLAVRVMDFIFLQGIDAIFKVILHTLQVSQHEILSLKSFESLMNYMKDTIPQKIIASFESEYRLREIFSVDLSTELRELEIEYKVLHEDLENPSETHLLETKYNVLKLQNKLHSNQITQLNRELELCRSEKRALSGQLDKLKSSSSLKMEQLSSEVEGLQSEVETLRRENLFLRRAASESPSVDPLSILNIEMLVSEQYASS